MYLFNNNYGHSNVKGNITTNINANFYFSYNKIKNKKNKKIKKKMPFYNVESVKKANGQYSSSHTIDENAWREQIGRSTWNFLHTTASKLPLNPSKEKVEAFEKIINSLELIYPCEVCRKHLKEHKSKMPSFPNTRKEIILWVCDLHNMVNKLLNKQEFKRDVRELDKMYYKRCSKCQVDSDLDKENDEENIGQCKF